MKIALFSDIHANLPALEAVLEDIRLLQPDMIFCLGDLVGYAPWPNEVVERVRSEAIPTIAGNYDRGVGSNSDDCGCAYRTDEDRQRGEESIRWTNGAVTVENREWLRGLPAHFRITIDEGDRHHLLMVHGSPRKINEYLFEDRPDKSLLRMMEKYYASILVCGHTHKPWHRVMGDGESGYRHAVNIGSVGKPKDGDPRACYAVLEHRTVFDPTDPDALKVTFHRVEYDVEKAAAAIGESPLPGAFADMLRNAY